MKRFKDLLLSIFIIGSIFVVILIVISFFNVKSTIVVTRNEANETRLNNLKYRTKMISDGECKDFLNNYIAIIEKGDFDGEVKLKDLYNYLVIDHPVLAPYLDAREKCDISNKELDEYGIKGKFLVLAGLSESLLNKYMFTYELMIKSEMRSIAEADTNSLLYSSIRFEQIELLNDFVDLVELKEGTNE